MENHDKGSYPSKVTCPREHHQEDGGIVMNHHLHEVFPLYIKELTDGQRPVNKGEQVDIDSR